MDSSSIQSRLNAQRKDSQEDIQGASLLSNLKLEVNQKAWEEGIYDEQERKKKEEQLHMILKNALFLQEDEARKKRWLEAIPNIPYELLTALIPASIRENLRYKQHKRNLVLELNKNNAE